MNIFGWFKKKPLYTYDVKQHHDMVFGEGSWNELEKRVMARMKEKDPFTYALIKEMEK